MCGIAGSTDQRANVQLALDAIEHRGPDARGTCARGGMIFGHVRLAIMDTSSASDQPFHYGDGLLCLNGEVWNYLQLRDELAAMGHEFTTTGDTEVLAAALCEWGPDQALRKTEGMFAFAWHHPRDGLVLARDRFGEIPLHVAKLGEDVVWGSEVKALLAMGVPARAVMWMPPGSTLRKRGSRWEFDRWYRPPAPRYDWTVDSAREAYAEQLRRGAHERAMSDVPVCALLSGGIDSAAVVWELARIMPGLVCYVAAPPQGTSADVRCAREVAQQVGADLREVRIPAPSASDLASVVRRIEMPYKAQVEIAWACLHLAERMQADGFRVTYSGEGADELLGSYNFARTDILTKGWHRTRWDLFSGQHRKNFARCNKVFMAHGVECRLPYLHTGMAESVLSMPRHVVRYTEADKDWKSIAVHAYGQLPRSVVTRRKSAFQVGIKLKEMAARAVSDPRRFYWAEHESTTGTKP
jgi:asparagine synthase (glutamine-hydrolysing)